MVKQEWRFNDMSGPEHFEERKNDEYQEALELFTKLINEYSHSEFTFQDIKLSLDSLTEDTRSEFPEQLQLLVSEGFLLFDEETGLFSIDHTNEKVASFIMSEEVDDQSVEGTQEENVVYTALFVDNPEGLMFEFRPVHPNLFYHHMTIEFKPFYGKDEIEVGKKIKLPIIGRVTTDKVDVLLVETSSSSNEHPHITLSTNTGVSPASSKSEIVKAIAQGSVIEVSGQFIEVTEGYFNGYEDVTFEE